MKKKNILIIILIAIIAVLGIVAAITVPAYLRGQKKEKEQIENNKEENKEEENIEKNPKTNIIEDEEIINLYEGLNAISKTSQLTDCAFDDFVYYKNQKVEAKDISQDSVTFIVLNHLLKEGIQIYNGGETFTKTKVHEIVRKVFGKDYQYEDRTIYYCPGAVYDGEETYTVRIVEGCGGSCGRLDKKKLVDAKKEEDTIYLYVRVLFVSNNNKAYYKDFNKTQKVVDGFDITDSDYEKGSLYKLVFQKEDGNYVFRSSEPVE